MSDQGDLSRIGAPPPGETPGPGAPSPELDVTGSALTVAPTADQRPNRRKSREGTVVSAVQDKTAVVQVIERVRHPRYAKTVQRTKSLYAHDEANQTRVGDRVRLVETRPLSKLKRWRVVDILERAR